jgi:hypothetical protein
MTMAKGARTRRDRWADWFAIGVVVVALLLGWVVKVWAEGGKKDFSDPETGLTLSYPAGWLMASAEDYVFRARDPQSGPFKITYLVIANKLDAAHPMSLMDAVNATSVNRARKLTAFRLLDIEAVDEEGQSLLADIEATDENPKPPSAIWSRYVYVEEKPDPFRESLPVVVLGLDYTAVRGGYIYTFTLLASELDFDEAEKHFRAFLQDAGFGG